MAGTRRFEIAGAVIPIEIVITGLDPVIHLLRKNLLRRLMDARSSQIKSGHDECVARGALRKRFAQTPASSFKQPHCVPTQLRDPAARCARVLRELFAPKEG